jgi:HlyD family secretion protein
MMDPVSIPRRRRLSPLSGLILAALAPGCEDLAVTAIRVDTGPVESTVTSVEAGVVEPEQKANLSPPVAGRIMRIHCAEGDRVEEGQILVELENDLEKLRLDEAASALKRLKDLGPVATDEERERADFALRRAKTDHDRTLIRALFSGFVAELNARLGEMTYGSLSAAFGGGARGMGAEPMVYLIDDSQLYVEAEIDEADVFRARVGHPAVVTLGGTERRQIAGRVSFISQHVSTKEGESRTAKVRVELERPAASGGKVATAAARSEPAPAGAGEDCPSGPAGGNGPVLSPAEAWDGVLVGMSADIEILVDRAENVTRIPTNVILEKGEEKYVFAVTGEKLQRRSIVTGIWNWALTEVKEGLSPGDLVVIPVDMKSLEEGRKVKVSVDDRAGP